MMLLRSTSSIVLALSLSDQYNILMLLKIIGIGICLIGGFSKKAKNKLRSLLLAGLAVLVLFLFHFKRTQSGYRYFCSDVYNGISSLLRGDPL